MSAPHYHIEKLGHQGDGLTTERLFLARSLPDEVVTGEINEGRIDTPKIITASEDRVRPPCSAFKACGGCSLQHASDHFVATWKEHRIRQLISAIWPQTRLLPVDTSPAKSRRRARLAGKRSKKGVLLGFHARRSEQIIDAAGCQVLSDSLRECLAALAELTAHICSRKEQLIFQITQCDNGIDLSVEAARDLSPSQLAPLHDILRRAGIIRFVWNGQKCTQEAPPIIAIGPAKLRLPTGAFLQATPQGEYAMVSFAKSHLINSDHILDLFSGCGTFALNLAQASRVTAIGSAAQQLNALQQAANTTTGLLPLVTQNRNLFSDPLSAQMLNQYDAIILDPPRAGAQAQIAQIARSDVRKIVYVSCNPDSFARDLGSLIEAGYTCDSIQPIDQFRWSHHIELAAFLQK